MQNSEAVQAWFQGKMASFRILGLVSKNEIRSREFSFSSRSLRVKIINLDLVSMPEIGGNFFSVSSRSLRVSVRNSRSRLDERDWIGETLILVSRLKKRLSLTTGLSSHWPGTCIEIRQACSPLIQLFFGFASDIDQTNINRDIRDGNWQSTGGFQTSAGNTAYSGLYLIFFAFSIVLFWCSNVV